MLRQHIGQTTQGDFPSQSWGNDWYTNNALLKGSHTYKSPCVFLSWPRRIGSSPTTFLHFILFLYLSAQGGSVSVGVTFFKTL